MIYLDNAATTLKKPPQVIRAVAEAMETLGNSSRGTHVSSIGASFTVFGARERLARLFGLSGPDRVAFAHNATDALNTAICGLIGPGDHVVSTDLEHNSVLRPLYRLASEQGVRLDFAPADRRGRLRMGDFESLITKDTRAVVCTHASNLTGEVQDIRRISDIARARGALVIVDAAQTAGAIPVKMDELGADVICFTGHKGLMGPQGTGGLCVREGVEVRPLRVGGTGVQSYSETQPEEMPARLEAGTLNAHGIAGLSAALDFIEEVGIDEIARRERALRDRFLDGLRRVPGAWLCGDSPAEHTAVAAFNIKDYSSDAVADALAQDYGIAVRPGAHCAPRLHRALGTETQGALRFSFSYFTEEAEIDAALSALMELTSP